MKYYVIAVLAIAGGWHLYQKSLGDKDLLAGVNEYATKHPGETWSPRLHYYVGVIYAKREKHGQARDIFQKLLKDYPTCQFIPKSLVHTFRSSKEIHDWESATTALQYYVEEYPDGGDIGMVKTQLDKLCYEQGCL